MKYNKESLTCNEQIDLLISRKLNIKDKKFAIDTLKYISYYRFSAYFIPYQKQKDIFNNGVTFNQILDTYNFDRDLRIKVFDIIERIEVAVRCQIIYSMSHKYGSHWQYKESLFSSKECFEEVKDMMKDVNNKNSKKESFIEHYYNNYTIPPEPPCWMSFELLTFGQLSNLYKYIKDESIKSEIANSFGLHKTVFSSWLHTITYVRNICAHHSRLWNREFAIKPKILYKPKGKWIENVWNNESRVFYFLCILKYLLDRIQPNNNFSHSLENLFDKYRNVPIKFMGIPSNRNNGELLDWRKQDLWKIK